LYLSLGRKAGIRPGDLVGLIANESNLTGREIGPIKITEQYSIVGVPEARVDDVIVSLRSSLLKGKRPNARRYTE
jgi:ATP-dependent RNA helicase DeaD